MLSMPRELPDRSAPRLSGRGSFDCIAVRFANANSAQDDRWIDFMEDHEYFVYIVCSPQCRITRQEFAVDPEP